MSLLFAPCRRRLDCSSLRLLYRQLPETSQFRCASSSRTFQLDPLLVEVLNAPEKRFTKSKPVDLAKADLPLVDEWRRQFPALLATNHRVSIRNPKTASQLANAFIPDGSEGKVVIEAFPGMSVVPVSLSGTVSHKRGTLNEQDQANLPAPCSNYQNAE